MSEETWRAVEEYTSSLLLGEDPVLEAALAASAEAGLPSIQVSPPEGRFLFMIAHLLGANSVLEIGTLGGYSTICMGRALPAEGRLITLEIDPKCAAVAGENLRRAGLSDRVEIRLGPASESLARIEAGGEGPFDLTFIDADKRGTPDYFDAALRLSRPGSVIIVDNVVRKGSLLEADSENADIQGMRRFLDRVSREPRVTATVLQTVGTKGHDGFAFVRVNS
jgi:predicted O-methyltransferase YrrM